jgi:hypothetical protein
VKEARRAVPTCFGIVAAAAAVFVSVISTQTSSPWKNGWFILSVVVLGAATCVAVIATLPDIIEWLGPPLKRAGRLGRRPKISLGRWLYTSEGMKSPASMTVLESAMPGTGFRKMPGERLPWVRFVVLIACSRVGPDLDSKHLWSQFAAFLRAPAASCIATMLTGTRANLRWERRGTRRAAQIDAVLTSAEDDDAVAAARLNLPDDTSPYGRDNRCAAVTLHFEPPDKEGRPSPALSPGSWESVFVQVLELASEFRQFLEGELGLEVSADPPPNIVFKFDPQQDIAEMIDASGLKHLPGLQNRSEVIGYFIANQDGSDPVVVVSQMMTDVLRYGLSIER